MKLKLFINLMSILGVGLYGQNTAAAQDPFVHYDPSAILANPVKDRLMTLHFCPNWADSYYSPTFYKKVQTEQELKNLSTRVVLKKFDDGHATLNPKNESFGWSSHQIDLSKVDEEAAKRWWGGRNGGDYTTFELISERGETEMDIYHLDTKFSNSKISVYRVRGSGIFKPEWVELK